MHKVTKILFSLADTVAYLQILVTVLLTIRLLGQVLTITFATSTAGVPPEGVLSAWAWFALALVSGGLAVFGCILHIKRQVLGVFLIAFVGLVGLLMPPFNHFAYITVVTVIQVTIFALPWTLMYFDLKKRGVVPPPAER